MGDVFVAVMKVQQIDLFHLRHSLFLSNRKWWTVLPAVTSAVTLGSIVSPTLGSLLTLLSAWAIGGPCSLLAVSFSHQ
jgi:hypothetical protein